MRSRTEGQGQAGLHHRAVVQMYGHCWASCKCLSLSCETSDVGGAVQLMVHCGKHERCDMTKGLAGDQGQWSVTGGCSTQSVTGGCSTPVHKVTRSIATP